MNVLKQAIKLRLICDVGCRIFGQGPVSRKPRKRFGTAKPFLVYRYLKTHVYTPETSCMKRTSVYRIWYKSSNLKQALRYPPGISAPPFYGLVIRPTIKDA